MTTIVYGKRSPASFRRQDFKWLSSARPRNFCEFERPDAPGCLVLDLATSRYERAGTPGTVVSRRYPADHLHLRTRRYPFFRARHQGRGDRVPSEALRRSGIAAGDSRRHRSGSNRAADRVRNSPNCNGTTTCSRLANGKFFPSWWLASPTNRRAPIWAPAEITIGVHRGQIMRKMAAKSLAELVRMADRLGLAREPSEAV